MNASAISFFPYRPNYRGNEGMWWQLRKRKKESDFGSSDPWNSLLGLLTKIKCICPEELGIGDSARKDSSGGVLGLAWQGARKATGSIVQGSSQ